MNEKRKSSELALVAAAALYLAFVSQGIPLWDDDYTSIFRKITDRSLGQIFLSILSPLAKDVKNWSFNERPIQTFSYKLSYLITGYESWFLLALKCAALIGSVVFLERWINRMSSASSSAVRWIAVGCALLFLTAPGTMAAHVIISDFAPLSSFIFLGLTYWMWNAIESTPVEWRSLLPAGLEQLAWIRRWVVIAFLTYIGYKCKADTKLIPLILGAYILLVRPRQWKIFALPLGLMILGAIPWGPGLFSKLPPFMLGSRGSEINWMWQPPSFQNFLEYIWSSQDPPFKAWLSEPTLSLGAMVGPILLIVAGLTLLVSFRFKFWRNREWLMRPEWRARIFVGLWMLAVLASVSVLAPINYYFRIRYGIMTMGPACLCLGACAALLIENQRLAKRWVIALFEIFVAVQIAINTWRSFTYRHSFGVVVVSIEGVYDYLQKNAAADSRIALLPGFLNYDYWPGSNPAFLTKAPVASVQDLVTYFPADHTFAISWDAQNVKGLEEIANFSGCKPEVLFDRLYTSSCNERVTHLFRLVKRLE